MLRINLLVAVAVAAGVVGCAQCDTCDDFPAPCTGPNCGQAYGVPTEMSDPGMSMGAPVMGPSIPMAPAPAGDDAGPAPAAPAGNPESVAPADGAASPPAPMDPFSAPK